MYDFYYDTYENSYMKKDYNLTLVTKYFETVYKENDDKDTWFSKIQELSEKLGYAGNMKEYKENPDAYKGNVADVSTVIRVALTTSSMTPDLYELLRLIGKTRIKERFNRFN